MPTRSPHRPDPALVTDLARRVIAQEGTHATIADVDRVGTHIEVWPESITLDSSDYADLLEAVADRIAEIRENRAPTNLRPHA